jgi:hypothetical protein
MVALVQRMMAVRARPVEDWRGIGYLNLEEEQKAGCKRWPGMKTVQHLSTCYDAWGPMSVPLFRRITGGIACYNVIQELHSGPAPQFACHSLVAATRRLHG